MRYWRGRRPSCCHNRADGSKDCTATGCTGSRAGPHGNWCRRASEQRFPARFVATCLPHLHPSTPSKAAMRPPWRRVASEPQRPRSNDNLLQWSQPSRWNHVYGLQWGFPPACRRLHRASQPRYWTGLGGGGALSAAQYRWQRAPATLCSATSAAAPLPHTGGSRLPFPSNPTGVLKHHPRC